MLYFRLIKGSNSLTVVALGYNYLSLEGYRNKKVYMGVTANRIIEDHLEGTICDHHPLIRLKVVTSITCPPQQLQMTQNKSVIA